MNTDDFAHLINRGEQFESTISSTKYTGQCAWSAVENANSQFSVTYPVFIETETIRRTGLFALIPLSPRTKKNVGIKTCKLLNQNDKTENSEYIPVYRTKVINENNNA